MTQFAETSALPRDTRLWRALGSDPLQEYILYVPSCASDRAPVLLALHGISGNAHEHSAALAPICDQYGVVMVVPVFTESLHKDYQRLGRSGRGRRSDLMMHNVLAEVALLSRADVTRTYVFGYSGGAQLAHRYTMAHPRRVARAVIAASGWYTFPDRTQRFPYGIRSVRTLKGVTFHAEDFLRVPIEVMIGTQDTTMHNVRSTARTVAQQGTTRLDRARNWVAAMQRAAATFGLEPRVTLTEVHEVGHDFIEFCERGNLAQRVGRSLFGDSALGDSAPTVARPSGHTLAGSDHQRDLDA